MVVEITPVRTNEPTSASKAWKITSGALEAGLRAIDSNATRGKQPHCGRVCSGQWQRSPENSADFPVQSSALFLLCLPVQASAPCALWKGCKAAARKRTGPSPLDHYKDCEQVAKVEFGTLPLGLTGRSFSSTACPFHLATALLSLSIPRLPSVVEPAGSSVFTFCSHVGGNPPDCQSCGAESSIHLGQHNPGGHVIPYQDVFDTSVRRTSHSFGGKRARFEAVARTRTPFRIPIGTYKRLVGSADAARRRSRCKRHPFASVWWNREHRSRTRWDCKRRFVGWRMSQ